MKSSCINARSSARNLIIKTACNARPALIQAKYVHGRPVITSRLANRSSSSLAAVGEAAPATVMESHLDATADSFLRVFFIRKDREYEGWGLHVFGEAVRSPTSWSEPLPPSGMDAERGLYWDVAIKPGKQQAGFLVHKGDTKAAGGELSLPLGAGSVWLVEEQQEVLTQEPDLASMPAGTLLKSFAHWVLPDVVVVRRPATGDSGPRKFNLHVSAAAVLDVTGDGVVGADESFELEVLEGGMPASVQEKFPFLAGCTALKLPSGAVAKAAKLAKGQVALSLADGASGACLDATGVQLHGLMDELFYTDAPLGDVLAADGGADRTLALWAPTALSVELLLWDCPRGGEPQVHAMAEGDRGVWSLQRPASWTWQYYKYRVKVYCPWTRRIEVSESTDPYSRGLAADGERSQFVDLAHESVTPAGWVQHAAPALAQWTDVSLYELHVRDFSAGDASVPAELRGKYLAFSPDHVASGGGPEAKSAGLKHLAELRAAGLNHLHLLPTYDFGSVPERAQDQKAVEEDLSVHPSDSERQQAAVRVVAEQDAFNWGYDPVHWGVPDGSYATDPDGAARLLEFRTMVQALHAQGWRVVQDVVYNHLLGSGPHGRHSVLDKVVPGYYLRREEDGSICNSTCMNNTASENLMCERAIVDDVVHWARDHKVDGFRWDLMGHVMLRTLLAVRAALDKLTAEADGVVGKDIYIYGEAWNFGEVEHNARGKNTAQMNLAGTRIGAFNDLLRDSAVGGGPFSAPDIQGFVTGLSLAINKTAQQGSEEEQKQDMLRKADNIRFSLAGNLRGYSMQLADGTTRAGGEMYAHGGLLLAYGGDPCENVIFMGCHDNQTLFDQITEKSASAVPLEERVRMHMVCLSMSLLAQGVPFMHAADDLLRSKSLDRDSYNSGDWFNRIDWTGQTNNFGVGLPGKDKNGNYWPFKKALLADVEANRPPPQQISLVSEATRAMLRMRYSSPLFRMASASDVISQLTFHNTGPEQIPGVIVMELRSAPSSDGSGNGTYCPQYERIAVVFNASPLAHTLAVPAPADEDAAALSLHPLLGEVPDERLRECVVTAEGALQVPARTTAVFVARRPGAAQQGAHGESWR